MGDYFSALGGCLWWLLTGLPRALLGIVVTIVLIFAGGAIGVYVGYLLDMQFGIDALGVVVAGIIIFFYYFTLLYLVITDHFDRLYGWFFDE